jgi:CHAT domain-containing protein
MRDLGGARPLYERALAIWEKELGSNHPDTALGLNNLGHLLAAMGDLAEARPLYERALAICEKELGRSHPDTARGLNNLGSLLEAMGDLAEARPLYERALAINEKQLGPNHPRTAVSLNSLAVLCVGLNQEDEAFALMQRAATIEDRMIGQIFSIGSDSQRMDFLKTIRGSMDMFLSLVFRYFGQSTDAARSALDLVLRRKAIAAEALSAQRDAVLGGRYPNLEPALRQWADLRMQIAQKQLAGPGREGRAVHERQLAEWETRKGRLEAELVRQIPEMNLEQKLRQANRRAVALALDEGVCLVEFIRFHVFDFKAVAKRLDDSRWQPPARWGPARYLAFVVPAGDADAVRMIDLGETEPVDRMIDDFRATISGERERRVDRDLERMPEESAHVPQPHIGSVLRAAVFDLLVSSLAGCKRLLLAPDGDLARLPFEVLPTNDGHLIDDYQISYLSTGRDVLRFGATSRGQPGAPLVAADPDFDLAGETAATGQQRLNEVRGAPAPNVKTGLWSWFFGRRTSRRSEEPRTTSIKVTSTRSPGRQSRDLNRNHLSFSRLPGTRAEGERVADLLKVQPWLEGTALEGRLKACRSPRILHLATHGFFLPDQQFRNVSMPGWEIDSGMGRLSGPGLENPLLRSGLALAGANTWLKGGALPREAEDGLLTAEDVSGLDLLDTELVVLSACQTGLGKVHAGEGVFGLRRAFILAGARTLVMSLWKVPDLATAVLMERFYDNLLNRGLARDEALRNAQFFTRAVTIAQLREDWLSPEMIDRLAAGDERAKQGLQELAQRPDDDCPFRQPLYWGAFICQGDPAPLAAPPTDGP